MKRVMMYDEWSDETDNESEIIKQFKEKFHTTTKNSEEVQILTTYVFCQNVGHYKNSERVWCNKLYGSKSKRFCEGEGVFATPNPKLGYP